MTKQKNNEEMEKAIKNLDAATVNKIISEKDAEDIIVITESKKAVPSFRKKRKKRKRIENAVKAKNKITEQMRLIEIASKKKRWEHKGKNIIVKNNKIHQENNVSKKNKILKRRTNKKIRQSNYDLILYGHYKKIVNKKYR